MCHIPQGQKKIEKLIKALPGVDEGLVKVVLQTLDVFLLEMLDPLRFN